MILLRTRGLLSVSSGLGLLLIILLMNKQELKWIPGAHKTGTMTIRRSLTQGNKLRESNDQLHEAM